MINLVYCVRIPFLFVGVCFLKLIFTILPRLFPGPGLQSN